MITETMTIHEALSELKVLDKRINSKISEAKWCVANKHSNQKIDGKSIQEYKQNTKAQYESVLALISRRRAIRNALAKSNASTEVQIGSETYTVSEAIEMRKTGIELKNLLLNTLSYHMTSAQRTIDNGNGDKLQKAADDYIVSLFGNKEKIDPETVKKLRDEYIEKNTVDFIDPIFIKNEIAALTEEVDSFTAAVDAKLSMSNAITTIEVSY